MHKLPMNEAQLQSLLDHIIDQALAYGGEARIIIDENAPGNILISEPLDKPPTPLAVAVKEWIFDNRCDNRVNATRLLHFLNTQATAPSPLLPLVREKLTTFIDDFCAMYEQDDDLTAIAAASRVEDIVKKLDTLAARAHCQPIELDHMTKPMIAPLTKGRCVPAPGKKVEAWIVWTEEVPNEG